MLEYLKIAGKIALPTNPIEEIRNFFIGCVGIRNDGALVSAKNGAVHSTQVDNYQLLPDSHAEGRVLRKLGKGGTLYVSRIARGSGGWAMARPCKMCRVRLKSFDVKKAYYTIDNRHYGVWLPKSDTDIIFEL